jgi:ribosomal-protein-alanine N-acetyltransferase
VSASLRIWQGGRNDAALLAALHAPAFSDAWPEPAFASLLERDGVTVLLGALGEGAARGFILVRAVADEAEVLTFCVADDARRHGLGRALLEAACDSARDHGAAQLFLEVGSRNEAAIGLYRSAGFVEVGRRAAYYHHGDDASDALVMRRILN